MSKFFLANNVQVGTNVLYAGSSIDDAYEDTTAITNAGGVLYPASATEIATAAAAAQAAKLRGAPPEELQSIMDGGVAAYTQSHDTVVANVKRHSTTLSATSLPAKGVTMHAQVAAGAAVNANSGFTLPLPRRSVQIVRQNAGTASVNYTMTYTNPDGTAGTVTKACAKGATTDLGVAPDGNVVITTAADPGGTTDFTTGDGFSVGEPVASVIAIACLAVVEAVVASDLPSGTVYPTTSPDGTKAYTVAYTTSHTHSLS